MVYSDKQLPTVSSPLEKAEEARDRLYRFQYVTAALTQAVTPMQIAEIMVSLGAATLHAAAGSVWLFGSEDKLSIAAYTGYTKEQIAKIVEYREKGSTPTLDAIRYKKPILLRSLRERKTRYPHTLNVFTITLREAFIAIPLLIGNKVLGAVNFAFQQPQTFGIEEQEFIYAIVQQCTQALDRAGLYDEVLNQKKNLEAAVKRINSLQNVTTLLSQALTAEEMANIILKEGATTLGAIGGEVCALTPDKQYVKIISAFGYPASYMKTQRDKELSTSQPLLIMDAINTKKTIVVEDLSLIPSHYTTAKEFNQVSGFRSGIFIPLMSARKLRGALTLFFDKTHTFEEEEIKFLTTLAEQFVQAYDRAKIYENEKLQKDRLEYLFKRLVVLQDVTKVLSSALRLEDVLEIILKRGVKALGAMGGEISILNEDKKQFRVVAYKGYPREFTKNFTKEWQNLPQTQPLLMWDAVKEKKAFFLSDIADVPTGYKLSKKFSLLTNAQSSAIVPFIVNGRAFGIFYLLFKKKNLFLEEDKQFIFTLSQHASQAIERAEVYEKEKQTMESLRQSEENWKQLAEAIPQLVWTGSANGQVDYYNKRWEKFTGIPQEDFLKVPYWEIAHPDDAPKANKAWQKALKEKTQFVFEYRLKSAQGTYIWFLSKALPIKNRKGDIVRWFGTLTDINEQKLIHLELEKREARFRALIENSSDAISLFDKTGKILYASPSTKKITGYSSKESIGKSIYNVTYPKDKKKIQEFVDNLLRSPEDKLVPIIYRRISKDGSIPWIEGVGRNLLNNPNVGALVLNYRDVTERVEADRIIQQAKEELEIIFENVADAIIVWNAKGEILYVNQAAITLNRYESVEEFLNDTTYYNFLSRFENIFDEDGKPLSEDRLSLPFVLRHKRSMEQIIKVILREDHTIQWRKIITAPVLDNQGNAQLIVSVIQDITGEKQKENTKDEFISTASHELKTPITSAKLYAGILSEKLQQKGDEKSYAIVAKLDTQLNRLTKLINDLLDVTKIRSGRISFVKKRVSIEKLVKDIIEEMQYTTITHTLQFNGGSKKLLLLDEERVRQVLVNLISNAIKYSPQANRVDISLDNNEKGVEICVKDYGVGIGKSDQKKIFEPFYRSISSGSNFPGLGLGLHIASEIIKRHGGSIKVESVLGKGTKMTVFLPENKHDQTATTR